MSNTEVVQQTTTQPKKRNMRHITSLVILSVIIPFFVFASLNPSNALNSYGYDIFYITVLGIVMLYGIFEVTNLTTPIHTKKTENIANTISMFAIFGSLFFWLSSTMINVNSIQFTSGSAAAEALLRQFDWVLFFLVFFGSMFTYILSTVVMDVDFKDQAITFIGSTLVFMFFTSLVFISLFMGWSILFWVILMVTFSDTMAYFGGRAYGKSHPFPKVSPKKTTEGLLIGFMASVLFGLGWYYITINPSYMTNTALVNELFTYTWDNWFVFVLLISLVSPFGDLVFSKMKRQYGKKDFSNLLPGHGGLMDRIDSHSITMSVATMIIILMIIV